MNLLILAFLFVTVTFGMEKPQFKVDNFLLGFNQELGLVSSASVKKCVETLFPTLIVTELVFQSIEGLRWNEAFINIPILSGYLDDFQDDCYTPWNAYSSYFGTAVSVFYNDPKDFFSAVLENLEQHKYDTILYVTDLIVFLMQGLDDKAGQTMASLAQIALSTYLPGLPMVAPV